MLYYVVSTSYSTFNICFRGKDVFCWGIWRLMLAFESSVSDGEKVYSSTVIEHLAMGNQPCIADDPSSLSFKHIPYSVSLSYHSTNKHNMSRVDQSALMICRILWRTNSGKKNLDNILIHSLIANCFHVYVSATTGGPAFFWIPQWFQIETCERTGVRSICIICKMCNRSVMLWLSTSVNIIYSSH